MTILFLHGWQSVPGGVKPTCLKDHGHTVINPRLPDEDFAEALRIAQGEFDEHQPHVVAGSSRGGAVAMNINTGSAKLVLLCPAWKKWGTARTVKTGTVILHSRADDVVPFTDSEELARNSRLPASALIEVGSDHRLADPEPLEAMRKACEKTNDVDEVEWDRLRERLEYQVVVVARLLQSNREFSGTAGVSRAPQIGDTATIVFVYDATSVAVECVNKDGMTVWLADFLVEELELLDGPGFLRRSEHGRAL